MPDTILYDSAMRLFAAEVTPVVVEDAEQGMWPDALWQAVEEAGYLDVLVDGPANLVEAATILRAAGHHAAPIPLVETMLARFLCAAARLPAPDGVLTIAPVEPGERLVIGGGAISGRAGHVPWGLMTQAVVVVGEQELAIVSTGELSWDASDNLAYESRDHMSAAGAPGEVRQLPDGIDAALVLRLGALMRAAQMAGAMEAALGLAVQYANDRVQFGRPIAKFQAIQHQLALLAEQVAAARVAADTACDAVAARGVDAGFAIACAKIRAGEAAGKVTDYAHQVHGAIGFTKEYSLQLSTRRLWSWRDEFGGEVEWAARVGAFICARGADALWPTLTDG
jgi:alkylation response protein AidB-like acyl-CoA dehydrogenase